MASEQIRFQPPPPPQQHQQQLQPPPPSRKRWGGCWGGLSCFGKQKGGKRIVPAMRITEASSSANQPNGSQVAGNQAPALGPSLLAPPSSPASFSNSALQSTAQSPNCFLSANSPGGPSSTMYATGPYAHETQLVSPPVFSTFTTEPSTAPLTPPPELAHLTTPSSPDVPYAQFLSSAMDIKSTEKSNYIFNDLQATYPLYPGSPESLKSPISRASRDNLSSSFPERDFPSRWDPSISPQDDKYNKSESGRLFSIETDGGAKLSQDSNFFCPLTFAQFYLDQSSFSHSGGRLSVSREPDAYSNNGSVHQNRQSKSFKQDVEEIEAYRASFGFSADEIVTTTQYVEISDGLEDSFSMAPFTSTKLHEEGKINADMDGGLRSGKMQKTSSSAQIEGANCALRCSPEDDGDHVTEKQPVGVAAQSIQSSHALGDDEPVFSRMRTSKSGRKYHLGLSSSDAEIEYRRARSLRDRKGNYSWHD